MAGPGLIVVDASALLNIQVPDQPDASLCRRVRTSRPVAPDLLDLEVLHSLNRLTRSGVLVGSRAEQLAGLQTDAPVARIPHVSLLSRVWALRHSITCYDAAYVALAEQLDVPLVTCDAMLAKSNGHTATIELYPAA